ncbi:hypothetical protein V8D89_014363 [Ganoderma adspersum]
MKAFAAILSLAGIVASAAVPQQPMTTRNSSGLRLAWDDDRYEGPGLTFKLGFPASLGLNQSQCALTELKWTKSVSPYRLSITVRPDTKPGTLPGTPEVIEDIESTSYPLLIRGPAGGVLDADLTDAVGGRSLLSLFIFPSANSSCLD